MDSHCRMCRSTGRKDERPRRLFCGSGHDNEIVTRFRFLPVFLSLSLSLYSSLSWSYTFLARARARSLFSVPYGLFHPFTVSVANRALPKPRDERDSLFRRDPSRKPLLEVASFFLSPFHAPLALPPRSLSFSFSLALSFSRRLSPSQTRLHCRIIVTPLNRNPHEGSHRCRSTESSPPGRPTFPPPT